jgi:hypothetical protein
MEAKVGHSPDVKRTNKGFLRKNLKENVRFY